MRWLSRVSGVLQHSCWRMANGSEMANDDVFNLFFSAGTMFFSHNKSVRSVGQCFGLFFQRNERGLRMKESLIP